MHCMINIIEVLPDAVEVVVLGPEVVRGMCACALRTRAGARGRGLVGVGSGKLVLTHQLSLTSYVGVVWVLSPLRRGGVPRDPRDRAPNLSNHIPVYARARA